MITIEVTAEIKNTFSGVYMISFSNGYFYIGSSRNMPPRITKHVGYIKSGFQIEPSAKSLQRMVGFKGHVIISLIEAIDAPRMNYGPYKPIVDKEMEYIRIHEGNPFILNDTRKCGIKRKSVHATVKIDVYNKLVAKSQNENKALCEVIEEILTSCM